MLTNTPTQKVTFSIPEFCRLASIGRSMAYEEIKAGRLRILKCGRRTLIPVEAVNDWVRRLEAKR